MDLDRPPFFVPKDENLERLVEGGPCCPEIHHVKVGSVSLIGSLVSFFRLIDPSLLLPDAVGPWKLVAVSFVE